MRDKLSATNFEHCFGFLNSGAVTRRCSLPNDAATANSVSCSRRELETSLLSEFFLVVYAFMRSGKSSFDAHN